MGDLLLDWAIGPNMRSESIARANNHSTNKLKSSSRYGLVFKVCAVLNWSMLLECTTAPSCHAERGHEVFRTSWSSGFSFHSFIHKDGIFKGETDILAFFTFYYVFKTILARGVVDGQLQGQFHWTITLAS